MSTIDVNMMLYCSKDEGRIGIEKPFRRGEYLYATDGRIMIRRKAVATDPEESEFDHTPSLKSVHGFYQHFDELSFRPLELTFEFWPKTCPTCDGDKKQRLECETCDGDGQEYCPSCDHSHPCPICSARGFIQTKAPCEKCKGSGSLDLPVDVQLFGPVWFSGEYLWLLKNDQDPASIMVAMIDPGNTFKKLAFKNGPYEGLLMSMTFPNHHPTYANEESE